MTGALPDDPAGLLPVDGRFGSGPWKVRPSPARTPARRWGPHYGDVAPAGPGPQAGRTAAGGARRAVLAARRLEVVLGNGGATEFWDIAAFGLIFLSGSQHLSFGEFSAVRRGGPGAPFLGRRPWSRPDPGGSRRRTPRRVWTRTPGPRDETSTGSWRRYAASRRSGRRRRRARPGRRRPAPAGCPSTPRAFDVYYFAPQKGWPSDGGLWLALMSPAALDRAARGRR